MYWQPFFNRGEGTEGESGTRAAGWGQGGDGTGVFRVPSRTMEMRLKNCGR
ncbi:hypothetical protein HMPREF1548_03066, partial [Clostridium sp. KLE 1755]